MKTLFLLRHAKSSWKDDALSDHERPLNKRGRATAPRMGAYLAEHELLADVIISSTAVRAKSTAELIVEHSGFKGDVHFTDELYPTTPARCLSVLQRFADEADSAMLVGHNPGLEETLCALTGRYERLPTCALARIALPVESWDDVTPSTAGELIGVWRPRELFARD